MGRGVRGYQSSKLHKFHLFMMDIVFCWLKN